MREYNNDNILIFLGGSCGVNLDVLDMDFIVCILQTNSCF